MSFRLIDLMCQSHRDLVLGTRIWPHGYKAGNHNPGDNSCYDCGVVGGRQPSGKADILPGLNEREAAAIHEAGHGVAGLACEYTICYLSMESSGRDGSTAHYVAEIFDYQRGSSGHAVMGLAGSAAGRRWARLQGSTSDADLIDTVSTGSSDMEEMFEYGWTLNDLASRIPDADAVVDLHWPAIERVAEALLAAGRLDGEQVSEIADLRNGVTA